MRKDFIYIEPNNLWININHIIKICISNETIHVVTNEMVGEGEHMAYRFGLGQLKYFNKIIGDNK